MWCSSFLKIDDLNASAARTPSVFRAVSSLVPIFAWPTQMFVPISNVPTHDVGERACSEL